MRETRSSGSVEGVMSNRDPYSDYVVARDRAKQLFAMDLSCAPAAIDLAAFPARFEV